MASVDGERFDTLFLRSLWIPVFFRDWRIAAADFLTAGSSIGPHRRFQNTGLGEKTPRRGKRMSISLLSRINRVGPRQEPG